MKMVNDAIGAAIVANNAVLREEIRNAVDEIRNAVDRRITAFEAALPGIVAAALQAQQGAPGAHVVGFLAHGA
jgi:hypothetical protein